MSIVEYLCRDLKIDPSVTNNNSEDCLCLAIRGKKRDCAKFFVNDARFDLTKSIEGKGFNYLAYAIVKGEQNTASHILKTLQTQNKATPQVLNQEIRLANRNQTITLLDLCIERKYKPGILFLQLQCNIQISEEKQELIA